MHNAQVRKKVYSFIENWNPIKLNYIVDINMAVVPHPFVEWCRHNCEGKWSWWFEGASDWGVAEKAFISFDNKADALIFKLKFVERRKVKCLD